MHAAIVSEGRLRSYLYASPKRDGWGCDPKVQLDCYLNIIHHVKSINVIVQSFIDNKAFL